MRSAHLSSVNVLLKYALLRTSYALQLNLFEQPATRLSFNHKRISEAHDVAVGHIAVFVMKVGGDNIRDRHLPGGDIHAHVAGRHRAVRIL